MYNNDSNSRAASARGCMAFFAMLALGFASMARTAEAAPFAYVANGGDHTVTVIDTATNPPSVVATVPGLQSFLTGAVAVTPDGKHAYVASAVSNTVSVIDTATNTVVGTPIPVGNNPFTVAIAPDGKHAYVANFSSSNVSVIDTASNTVVATVSLGIDEPQGVAVAPDGKHAYVTNFGPANVSVIDTATNTVTATIPVGSFPFGVAFTPDGKRAYVANSIVVSSTVSVIDTTTNPPSVVATVPVGSGPFAVAVTPDGKYAYVANSGDGTVSVIATATNTVVATIPVAGGSGRVAVTPDGKHAYVTNTGSNSVSVIDTATNTVVATVPVGVGPLGVAIIPPPPGVPFLAFDARLAIAFGGAPNHDSFALQSSFTLSSTAPAINPVTQPVTFQVGTFATSIPPGFFKEIGGAVEFVFAGVINGVSLQALILQTGTLRYAFDAKATGASFAGTKNPAYITLTIGGDSGATSVTALIFH
jgi:YVTN family beta-propeller protein